MKQNIFDGHQPNKTFVEYGFSFVFRATKFIAKLFINTRQEQRRKRKGTKRKTAKTCNKTGKREIDLKTNFELLFVSNQN